MAASREAEEPVEEEVETSHDSNQERINVAHEEEEEDGEAKTRLVEGSSSNLSQEEEQEQLPVAAAAAEEDEAPAAAIATPVLQEEAENVVLPEPMAWSGSMQGPLLKQNTSHGTAEYARKVYCVLVGYTLFEFDSEVEARAMLWPKAEADVIGVSPAPTNSSSLRASSLTMSSRGDGSTTFVYTTNAGERVCAVAPSPREYEKWIVALTLGVELLLLSGLPEAAGGAAQLVPHAAPVPETNASHCAASGQQFGYTVTRNMCTASGRAFSAANMAPAPLPLPGIGLSHAVRLSDACAQAQQLLNASRTRTRLLAAALHAAELEAVLVRKYSSDGRNLWLRHVRHRASSSDGSSSGGGGAGSAGEKVVDEGSLFRFKIREHESTAAAHSTYVAQVLDPSRNDPAALVLELHHLISSPPQQDSSSSSDNTNGKKRQASSETADDRHKGDKEATASSSGEQATSMDGEDVEDDEDGDSEVVAALRGRSTDAHRELRAALSMPAHTAAVRDACAALADVRAADDDQQEPLVTTKRNLAFYLPQLAHVYYRILPPRDANAALRATLVEDLLLRASRRSFVFALRLAWFLVAYLEDRGSAPARRPHVLRLLVELEAAAAYSYAGTTDALGNSRRRENGGGDPWTLRSDTVAAAAMARRGPASGDPSPFAGAVALELLPRAPAWLALELRRSAVALHKSSAKAIELLGGCADSFSNMLDAACTPSASSRRASDSAQYHDAPDDVLAREMRFVRAMCDVAETMRGVDLSQRPARLKTELRALPRRTPLGHSPIGPTVVRRKRSSKTLKSGRVARVPPNEGHVFRTKARAPTLVLLETVDDVDVSFQYQQQSRRHPQREDRKEPDDEDADADVVSNQRDSMRELLAPTLESGPPEDEDAGRGEEEEEPGIARRVASMPKILEAAYNAAQEEEEEGRKSGGSSKSASGAASATGKKPSGSGGPRRSSSMTSLAALPENPKRGTPSRHKESFDDENDDDQSTTGTETGGEDATDREGARVAAAPVASRSAARAEIVRALRQRPTLGLRVERLSSLSPSLDGGAVATAANGERPVPTRLFGSGEEEEDDDDDDADDFDAAVAATTRKRSMDAPTSLSSAHPQLLLPSALTSENDDLDMYAQAKRMPGFGEPWVVQRERVRRASPIGDEASWNLVSLIVKSNDDLRQEVCALQVIAACYDAFEAAGLAGDADGLWLRHYSIVPTGSSTGIIETMADAVSLDALKKNSGVSLPQHFRTAHKGPVALARARKAFVSSMAAYSLVCYILGLKDRHNGNILIDSFGHVIHIDFGFMLGQAPGGSFSLERVPFKLTTELVEAMGGWNSDGFADFVVLLACGFAALQAHSSKILALVEIMAKDSPFPCFRSGPTAVDKMRARFKLNLTTNQQVANHVAELVKQSYNAYGTRQYDSFQYLTNGIYS